MSKWKLRRSSEKIIGTLTSATIYGLDGDQCVFIRPRADFDWILRNEAGAMNKGGQIECEVEILDRYENEYLEAVRTLVGRDVAAHGVWVEDIPHDAKTELHPLDAIVGQLPAGGGLESLIRAAKKEDDADPKEIGAISVYRIVAGADDSWVQHPPRSDETRWIQLTVPFPPRPNQKPKKVPPAPVPHGWKPKWQPKFKVRQAIDMVDLLADDGEEATLTLRVAPRSYKSGGPGALVMDVATFWVPMGAGDIV